MCVFEAMVLFKLKKNIHLLYTTLWGLRNKQQNIEIQFVKKFGFLKSVSSKPSSQTKQ